MLQLSKKSLLDDIFRSAPSIVSEDDCAENIVIPFLLRLGYDRSQISRKVTITGVSESKFRKQADIIVLVGGSPAMVIETKRLRHRLNEEDANQALSYAQLLSPSAPLAILTNGKSWEVYRLFEDDIGSIEDVPDPSDLVVAVRRMSSLPISIEQKESAERLLVTIENKTELEAAFKKCRQALAKEGLIAESAFDELTKVLVCKFFEEKKLTDGLGAYRFSLAWLLGQGALAGLQEIFSDAKQTFKVFPQGTQINIRRNETVEEIVSALERFGFYGFKTPLGLAGAGGDVVGSVYETFLTGTLRGDLGQYLTPRHLIEFMVELADIDVHDRVLDLACGSGGFLIRAFVDLRKKIRSSNLSKDIKNNMINEVVLNQLWGVEINERLATLCRINMILHGDGYEHIYSGDSIRDDTFTNTDGRISDLTRVERGELPKFDVILMNPPFNLPYEDSAALNRYDLGRGKASQGSDYLMLERALKLVKEETGRILIIMPHGVASGASESDIREFIRDNSRVKGCISLPVGAFKPFGGSNARTCVLFLTKENRKGKRRFLARAESIGYDITTKYYREVEADDLQVIADLYISQKEAVQ